MPKQRAAFWKHARELLADKPRLIGAAVMALISAGGLGAGLLGMSPVLQMEIGHTRQYAGEPDSPVQPRESERLDLESLIRGYTIDAAYQLHMEDEIGSLEVGKKADLVILDRNLFEIDPYEIHQAQVIMTVMDGEVVYEHE